MSIGADDERMGYVVEHWISMERAIAMAWLHRHPDGTRTVIEDEIELVGSKRKTMPIAWKLGERMRKEPPSLDGERFKPLKWRNGLCPVPPGYQISNYGRLMNPNGRATRGLYFDGSRWAAVRNCGLVNLTVAARLKRDEIVLSASMSLAINALATGRTPSDLQQVAEVTEATRMGLYVKGGFLSPWERSTPPRTRVCLT